MIEGQAGQGQCTQMKLYTRIAATYWEQQIHAVRERRAAYLSCDCITLTKKTTYTNKLAGWRSQHCCCCWGEQQVSKSCINVWSAARRKAEGNRERGRETLHTIDGVIEIQMKVK